MQRPGPLDTSGIILMINTLPGMAADAAKIASDKAQKARGTWKGAGAAGWAVSLIPRARR